MRSSSGGRINISQVLQIRVFRAHMKHPDERRSRAYGRSSRYNVVSPHLEFRGLEISGKIGKIIQENLAEKTEEHTSTYLGSLGAVKKEHLEERMALMTLYTSKIQFEV